MFFDTLIDIYIYMCHCTSLKHIEPNLKPKQLNLTKDSNI